MLQPVSRQASEVRLGRLCPDDAASVARLLDQLGYPTDEAEARDRIAAWTGDERGAVFGASVDDRLAGCAAIYVVPFFERPGARARLVALVVDAEYRRRGIAELLVEQARKFARDRGAVEIEVLSRRTRPDAYPFYTNVGFADVSERARRYLSEL
jgi:GNAT superfamily N-acetyltransferase